MEALHQANWGTRDAVVGLVPVLSKENGILPLIWRFSKDWKADNWVLGMPSWAVKSISMRTGLPKNSCGGVYTSFLGDAFRETGSTAAIAKSQRIAASARKTLSR